MDLYGYRAETSTPRELAFRSVRSQTRLGCFGESASLVGTFVSDNHPYIVAIVAIDASAEALNHEIACCGKWMSKAQAVQQSGRKFDEPQLQTWLFNAFEK